jgi:hypothetical protein
MELPHTIDHAYGIVIATLSFIGYSDAAQQLVPSLHGRMISEPVGSGYKIQELRSSSLTSDRRIEHQYISLCRHDEHQRRAISGAIREENKVVWFPDRKVYRIITYNRRK